MNIKTTNAAITAGLELLGITAIYLLFAFVLWNGNPAQWSEDARFLAATIAVMITVAVIGSHSIRSME
jgi:hypothetical protein